MSYFGVFSQNKIELAAKAALIAYDGFSSVSMPKAWGSVTPSKDDDFQSDGFKGEFFISGQAAASVMRNGNKLIVSFRGTDNILDVYDDLKLAVAKNYFQKFSSLLEAVAKYVKAENISDVTFAGHSLGAAAVNMVADQAKTEWGGVFKNSAFIGFESPYLSNSKLDVFNFGVSNDPVYGLINSYAKQNNLSNTYFYGDSGTIELGDSDAHSMYSVKESIDRLSTLRKDAGFDLVGNYGAEKFVIFDKTTKTLDASAFSAGNQEHVLIIGQDKGSKQEINDKIYGTNFATNKEKFDIIFGLSGNDIIDAKSGNDRIYGGKGSDTLTGGSGNDLFIFRNSDVGFSDVILDFEHGDKIDLRNFDANPLEKGIQPLIYIGTSEFKGGSGQVRFVEDKKSTKVLIDADGDKKADLTIMLKNNAEINVKDFLGVRANHSYEVVTVEKGITWEEARAAAEAKGGHLATITSAAENKILLNLINNSKYWSKDLGHGVWLGGYQDANASAADEGWHWVTGEKWKFTAWVTGNPDDGGTTGVENVLELMPPSGRTATWNDVDGTNPNGVDAAIRSYVIEYDIFV